MSLQRKQAARLVGGVAAILALSFGFAAWRVHRGLAGRTGEVLQALSTAIGLPVEADEVAVAWWPPGIVVRGLRIPDRTPYGPGSLAHADEARLRLGMAALLRGQAIVRSVELDTPVVRLVRGLDGGWNVGGLGRDVGTPAMAPAPRVQDVASPTDEGVAARARPGVPSSSMPFRIASVRVNRGRVSLRDRAIPGMPEFEITSASARARRQGEGYVFELEADALGGPPLNLRGNLRIPGDGSDAVLKVSAAGVPSRRLPEVMQLLRGTVPFGASLGGVVSIDIDGRFPAAWPPSSASLDVALDAREAELRMAGGWVEKRSGTPLEVALALRATADHLFVQQATLEAGEARIALRAPDGESVEQRPLRVSSVDLGAERLADWVPILARIAPRGKLSLDGTLAPGGDVTAADLRLSGSALEVAVAKEPVQLGSVALDLEVQPGGAYAAGLSVDEIRSGDVTAERLTAALDAQPGRDTRLHVEGARGGRAGAELTRVAFECLLSENAAEVRRIEIEGLGGRLHGDGRIVRTTDTEGASMADADALTIRFDPRWEGVDLDGLQRLLGMPLGVRGELEGEAALEIQRENGDTLVDTLRGVFAARLREGRIADLNLARSTVDNLGAIPGLRQAVERRARAEAPALLARTSEIEILEVGGSVADGAVDVTGFRLVAPDYSVDTRGRVAFDGNFDLDGELVLGEHATEALASKSGILALLAPAGKSIRIPVSIEGVYPELVSAPSQAFVSGALPHAAREAEAATATGFLRRFLGNLAPAPSAETREDAPSR